MSWRTILVPYDFSAGADQAAAIAVEEARLHGARVLLLHVVELTPHFGPETTLILPEGGHTPIGIHHYARTRASTDLHAVAAQLPAGIVVTAAVREGAPAEEIVAFAREQAADVIVMGTHGRTGLRHLLAGSVAERVVRTSPVPVMTTRNPE